jgi:hypothetical protein
MNPLLRTTAVALVVVLLALGVFGLRLACSPSDYQELVQASRRREDLRERERASLRRRQLHEQAVQAWIAQRCTLAETMQRLQEGDREVAQEWPAYTIKEKGWTSDEDRHYQLILTHVEEILPERPEELATARCRLERDYQQLQANRQRPSTTAMDRRERNR